MTSSGADHIRAHASALGVVAAASVAGAVASFVFQIVTARFLGADDFGLLAAFLAIVNVAAIGSSALQNSVAVQTAISEPAAVARRHFGVPRDAVLVGLAGGVAVAAFSPWLAEALDASAWVVIAAAVSVPLSFLFAAYIGRVQGTGSAATAVGWSTASLAVRVLIAIPALALGAGIGGAVGAVVVATGIAAIGAAWSARWAPTPRRSIFAPDAAIVLLISVALAWLTNADVFLMRILAPAELAGVYAAVAVLVKASFILPSTLSVYLLPRFARNRGDSSLTRVGVLASTGISAVAGVLLIVLFAVAGEWVIYLLYGTSYGSAASLLVPVAAAYLPWIILQGLLIQSMSSASKAAAALLALGVVVQAVLFALVLPDVAAMLVALAGVGALLLAAVLLAFLLGARASQRAQNRKEQ